MSTAVIPRSSPFSNEQRQWLASVVGERFINPAADGNAPANDQDSAGLIGDLDSAPWHDMDLPLDQRIELVPEDGPFLYSVMAAMAQQDCGQCGYDCKGYAQALVDGRETDMSLCVPGGPTTRKAVKALFAEHGPVEGGHAEPVEVGPIGYDPRNPCYAPITSVYCLHGEGAPKDTQHAVVNLANSGISYKPGDSLGIYPRNDHELAMAVTTQLAVAPDTQVNVTREVAMGLQEALTDWLDITAPSDDVLELMANAATDAEEARTLAELASEGLDDSPLDIYDILMRYPSARPDVQAFVDALGRLRPRLYSIASSQNLHPDEVHLTVAVVRYDAEGRHRKGVASTYISERAEAREVPVYLQPAKDFGLPEDDTTPIIMVGPGTGIAPFRAFIEERHARGASGDAWLFFGNPHSDSDYIYRDELHDYLEQGALTHITTAFSRDGAGKVYVQDRIRENGAELWAWLHAGANFYVCGDAEYMALAVDQALREVVRDHGGYDDACAQEYVKTMTREGRYQRDVY